MYRVKTSAVITHVTGWFIFLSLPLLFIAGQSGTDKALSNLAAPWYWLLFGSYIAIFYGHTYYLFPNYTSAKNNGPISALYCCY
jgi:two-component system LytT family sensor kinase